MRHPIFYCLTSCIALISLLACNEAKPKKESTKPLTIDTTKQVMTDTLKDEVLYEIGVDIKSGFYDTEDVFSRVEDYLYEVEFDAAWARLEIDKAFAARAKEEANWPAITDFDKLARAFDELNSSGIV